MVNTPQHSFKQQASKFFKSVALTGGMLLFVLKPGISKADNWVKDEIQQVLKKTPAKERKIIDESKDTGKKIINFDTLPTDTIDAFTFATNNVSKYYPDMKEHLDTMINSFRDQEHKDTTIALLNKAIKNINDPKQKIGAIFECLETVIRKNQSFGLKYDKDVTDETFKYVEEFDNDYKAWFNRYYNRLIITVKKIEEELKKNKQDLEKNKQELEKNMSKFSSEDIKNNSSLKQLFITTETFYKEHNYTIPANIQKLFDATK